MYLKWAVDLTPYISLSPADPSWLPEGGGYLFTVYKELPEIHRAEARSDAVSERVLERAEQPSVAGVVR